MWHENHKKTCIFLENNAYQLHIKCISSAYQVHINCISTAYQLHINCISPFCDKFLQIWHEHHRNLHFPRKKCISCAYQLRINCISTAYHLFFVTNFEKFGMIMTKTCIFLEKSAYQLHIKCISTAYQVHINCISTAYQLHINCISPFCDKFLQIWHEHHRNLHFPRKKCISCAYQLRINCISTAYQLHITFFLTNFDKFGMKIKNTCIFLEKSAYQLHIS